MNKIFSPDRSFFKSSCLLFVAFPKISKLSLEVIFSLTFYAFICLQVNPGDEVVIVEPAYNSYIPMCRMVGGVPVSVPLRPRTSPMQSSADWVLDPAELESKFSENTKVFMLNNPGNPTGKVYYYVAIINQCARVSMSLPTIAK